MKRNTIIGLVAFVAVTGVIILSQPPYNESHYKKGSGIDATEKTLVESPNGEFILGLEYENSGYCLDITWNDTQRGHEFVSLPLSKQMSEFKAAWNNDNEVIVSYAKSVSRIWFFNGTSWIEKINPKTTR